MSLHFDPVLEARIAAEVEKRLAAQLSEHRKLQRKMEHLASLPEYNPDPVIEITAQGELTYSNRAAEELFGQLAISGREAALLLAGTPEEFCMTQEPAAAIQIRRHEVQIKDRFFAVSCHFATPLEIIRIFARDVTERRRAEESVQRKTVVLEGINRIFAEALKCDTEEELGVTCLRVAEEITGSGFGFIGEIGADGLVYDLALSDPGWELCAMPDQTGQRRTLGSFPLRGLYGRVLIDSEPLLANDPAAHPDSTGIPEGHPRLTSFLGVPLKHGGRTIGLIALANRKGGYRPEDREAIESLAPAVVQALLHKRAQEALANRELEYRTLAENTPEVIARFDRSLRHTFINEYGARVYGRPKEEIIGRTTAELALPAEQVAIWTERFEEAFATGEQQKMDFELDSPIDGHHYFSSLLVPEADEQGSVTSVLVITRDVTTLKRTGAELQQSEMRFTSTFENAAVGMAHVALDGRFLRFNASLCRITGYPPEELATKTFQQITHPEDLAADLTRMNQLRNGDIASYSMEKRYLKKDGTPVWVTLTGALQRNAAGEPQYFIVVIQDISDRKRTEEALKESENRFREAFAHAPVGMVITDLGGRFLQVNEAYCRLLGYDEQELLRPEFDFKRLTHPDDLERNLEEYDRLITGEIPAFFLEKRYLRKDGRPVWVRASATVRRDAAGRPSRFIGIIEDIDARKRAEEDLKKNQQRFQRLAETLDFERNKLAAVIENLPLGIGITDPDGTTTSMNEAGLRLHGFASEHEMLAQLDQYAARFELFLPDGRPMPLEEWPAAKALHGEYVKDYEVRLRNTRTGGERIVSYTAVPVRNSEGELVLLLYVMLDVTERRQAEAALRESEGRFRMVLENSLDAAYRRNLQIDRYDYVSPVIEQITGLTAEQFSRLKLEEVLARIHPEDIGRVRQEIGRVFTGEQAVGQADYRFKGHDGSYRWLSDRYRIIRDEAGRPFYRLGIVRDITRQRQAEEALRESEERFRMLADNISQFAWMADEKGALFWYNKRWYEYTGTTLEEMKGWGWRQVHHPEHVDRVVEKFSKSVEKGEEWEDTFPLRGKDGGYRWFLSRAVPIRDEQGRVRRWFGTNTDITELREAQESLRQTVEELGRSNRDLEQFAYIASHDLQTPLRSVTGFLDLLTRRYEGRLDPEAVEFITYAVEGAERMHQLINDILAFSRVGTSGNPFERLESGEPLNRALDNLRTEIDESGAEITVGALPEVAADRNQLTQLFQNLVGNALKYRNIDEPPRIGIEAEEREGEWEFRVRDNGIGIDAHNAERIFQIFQRLHTVSQYPGTGIGLAICKKIVERHGGRIWVESQPGKGATFCFTLPKV